MCVRSVWSRALSLSLPLASSVACAAPACSDGHRGSQDAGSDANLDEDGSVVHAFHNSNRCVQPDLDHGWASTHREVNYNQPNAALAHPRMDGFVLVNDETEQHDNGVESPTEDETMGFYTQDDLPFYYDLAQNFAIGDRFFASIQAPTFPNRAYLVAATSFGHLTTSDQIPPIRGYKPVHGFLWDLLDRNHVSWADYYQDLPQGASFRPLGSTLLDAHFQSLQVFLAHAAGLGDLPAVSFVDPRRRSTTAHRNNQHKSS